MSQVMGSMARQAIPVTIAGGSQVTVRPSLVGPLIVTAVFGIVASIFWPTFSYMLGFGREANSSAPVALVFVVVLALVWNLRDELVMLRIRPFLPGFIGLISLGFFWLAGQLVFTRTFMQFAVVAMVPMVVLTLLGVRWLVAMAFPFFMLLFALPVWSPLVPTLVKWSAKFAEFGIRASGVPIYRDGAYFVLPSGSWSIADSCSGVAYLSACMLLGILYAWTLYHSPVKRLLFIVGAGVIGVVGNWIRVYLTMMIAHLSDNRLLRDDHGPFGWWLFAVILGGFCWLGWRYRDSEPLASRSGRLNHDGSNVNSSLLNDKVEAFKFVAISVLILATLMVWPFVESRLSEPLENGKNEIADLSVREGWSRVEKLSVDWVPVLQNPSQVRVQRFEKGGRRVDVFIGVFRHETWDSKLVTVSNLLAGGAKSNSSLADRGSVLTAISGRPLDAKTGVILGPTDRILAWRWYWIDGVSTGNDLRAKLQQLQVRLMGKRPASAWVAIYTGANTTSAAPSELLEEFMRDMGGSLESALVQTSK